MEKVKIILEKCLKHESVILEDETFQNLQKPDFKKLILRWLFLIVGFGLLITAIIAFIKGWKIDGFEFNLNYENEKYVVNLSFIFPILMTAISLWLISRFSVNINNLRENTTYLPYISYQREKLVEKDEQSHEKAFYRIRSFASSRLIGAMFSIITGGIFSYLFGTDLTGQTETGNWLVLGGPTLFYPLSVIPIVIAVGLILYTIFSASMITFSKTKHFFQIEEYRIGAPWITEIPRNEIKAIRLTNAYTGPKYAWVFLLGFHIVWCLIDGLHFLLNPHTFKYGFQAGWCYLATAIVQLVVLLTLVLKTHTFLEIITDKKRYELQFCPPSAMPIIRGDIEEVFEIPALSEHQTLFNKFESKTMEAVPEETRLTHRVLHDWKNVIVGSFFIILSILSKTYHFFAGDMLIYILSLFGIFLIVKGIKYDFSSARKPLIIKHDDGVKILYLRHEWATLNTVLKVDDVSKENFRYDLRMVKLNVFDVAMMLILPLMLGITTSGFWTFSRIHAEYWFYGGMYAILSILILWMIGYILINPENALIIQLPSLYYEYPLPGTRTEEQFAMFNQSWWLTRSFARYKYAFQKQRGAYITRVLTIILAFLIGGIIPLYVAFF